MNIPKNSADKGSISMSLNEAIKNAIEESGRTQTWVASKANAINPSINLTVVKLNASLRGNRKITGDEFIALCKALEINPDSIADRVISR